MSLTLRPQLNLFDYSSKNGIQGLQIRIVHFSILASIILVSDVGDKNDQAGHQHLKLVTIRFWLFSSSTSM